MIEKLSGLIRDEEVAAIGIDSMSIAQQEAIASWGMRLFSMGSGVSPAVDFVDEIKYGGRLVILNDGSRWEVDALDASIADLWTAGDDVAVIDGHMYKNDDAEKIVVEEEL